MNIDYNKCAYMNAEKQNASIMMKPCINGTDPLIWPCVERETLDKDIFSFTTERPQGDNIQGTLPHSLQLDDQLQTGQTSSPQKVANDQLFNNPNIEGFTNMGESYVEPGDCPDGYYRCPTSGTCIQICVNCKFNERTYGQSKEFNEADPCFPDQGVYAGLDNDGNTLCTCGQRGQYCDNSTDQLSRDLFDAQGGLFSDNQYIMNVGDFGYLGNLVAY